ncbi:MAG: ribonuclease HII [Actinomycetales bacterium]|nr:ribonuclease HII [Actinomycetales bacterium]
MSSKTFPTLEVEQAHFNAGIKYVIGIDEVGRGALCGPVSVGVAILHANSHSQSTDAFEPWPAQLADSKLISEKVREQLFAPVGEWVHGWSVGSATNAEIDELGITSCLAKAAVRAVQDLPSCIRAEIAANPESAIVILDGSHNWLGTSLGQVRVTVRTKADRDCVSVAAASVLAKVARDSQMVGLVAAEPALAAFGIAGNKGYSSQQHLDALREIGPTNWHRRTWLTKILGEDALF